LKKSALNLVSALCLIGMLAGCSSVDKKDGTSSTKTDPDKTAGTSTTAAPDKAAETPPAVVAGQASDVTTTTTLPSGQKQIKISLDTLPNDMVICTVAGKAITIADYRRMLKLQQAQAQGNISGNVALRGSLFQEATKRGLALSAAERSKLLETAKAQHKDFPAFLKERNLTEAQFDKEVEQAGLVFKMSNAMIEEGLLSQLVSRQLLASAVTDPNAEKAATAGYEKLKGQTKDFELLRKATGLTSADLKTETVRAELARVQVVKLEQAIKITDQEIQDFYKKNQSQLKHNERIRMARIVVMAPEQSQGPILSIREQVKRVNPKLEGKDLDATVAQVLQQQQQKALVLLGEAKAGNGNFTKLANENTEDAMGRILKNGGDMGWQEKQQLVPQFAEAVWSIKPGTVLPKLVKTSEGYSIIKVTGHEKPGVVGLAEVRPLVQAKLKQDKLQKVINVWITEKQKTAKVEFSPKFLQIANGGEVPKVTTTN